ncbi:hypothetical protein SAY87_016535 [Trapa incisa]|uniref:Uncharacterized protein n=1 Tax=Trapa incisa TaxID=236973 RepID=A0AAN7L9F3_9MYRT|nr:hypothetical protein SAY87_016535 [Trapa incisa]
MPVGDPRAGRLLIWLISSFILFSLATGGAFLVVYLVHPESTTTASTWLLYAGMSLVCFPWFFWFILCVYRCISRSLGFRIVCCASGGGGDGDEGINKGSAGAGGSAAVSRAGSMAGSMRDAGNQEGKHVTFEEAVVENELASVDENSNDPKNIGSRSSSSIISMDEDTSFKSHESEIPLASAMAT